MADNVDKHTAGGALGGAAIGLITGGPIGLVVGGVLGGLGGRYFGLRQEEKNPPSSPPS